MKISKEFRAEYDPKGYWPAFTSIGCYTLIYLTKRGDTMCAKCAFEARDEDNDPPVDYGTYDEGPPLQCDACNEDIESSYGDPDADDEVSS